MKTIESTVAFTDPQGNALANGFLILQLSQNAEITSGGGQIVPKMVAISLDATGKIPAATQVWANDELTPSGTTYTATVTESGGTGYPLGKWSIAGASPIDVSQMTPLSVGASFPSPVLISPSGNQVIVQPSGTNLSVNRFENIRFADQFPGATSSDQIGAALADLPAAGGTVDARALQSSQSMAGSVTIPSNCTVILGAATYTCPGSGAGPNPAAFILGNNSQLIGNGTTITGNNTGNIINASSTTNAVIANLTLNGTLAGTLPNDEAININGATGFTIANVNWAGGQTNVLYEVAPRTDGTAFIRFGPPIQLDNTDQGLNITAFDLLQRFASTTNANGSHILPLQVRAGVGTPNDAASSGTSFIVPITGVSWKNDPNDVRPLFGANFQARWYSGSPLGGNARVLELDFVNNSGNDPGASDANTRNFVGISVLSPGANPGGTAVDIRNGSSGVGWHHGIYISNFDTAGIKIQAPSTTTIPAITIANNGLSTTEFQVDGAGNTGVGDGGATAPSLYFQSTTNSGWSKPGAGYWRFISNATDQFSIGANAISLGSAVAIAGSNGNSFSGTDDVFLYRSAANTWGLGTAANNLSGNLQLGAISLYGGTATAGQGVPPIYGATKQKAETGSADANVLTVTPPAAAGTYRITVGISVASATSGVISYTVSWKDANGNAQTNIAGPLFQFGTAAPNTTFTTSAVGNYSNLGGMTIDIDNSATNIVVKWVGGGTSSAKMSATIERIQ